MKLQKFISAFALAFLFLTPACKKDDPKDDPAYAPPEGSYKLVFEKIFKPSCALSNCHSKEGDFGHHGLGNNYTYEHLLNEDCKNADAKAAGLRLIKPGDPDQSFLFAKIKWTGSPYRSTLTRFKDNKLIAFLGNPVTPRRANCAVSS